MNQTLEQYKKGGRDDLAEKELFELSLLDKYLPEHISQDEIRTTVKNTIKSTGAESMQEMGKVMGAVMKEMAETADGKLVQQIVQEELN